MGKKINVGILFGGKSAEHEVSLQSARNVFDALDREKYNPVLIGINKNGQWLLGNESRFLLNTNDPKKIKLDSALNPSVDQVALAPESGGLLSSLSSGAREQSVDVVFPILHGPFGEDGTVQGLLKLAGIPFVGAGVLASAAGMDKDVMKRLFRDSGLPIAKFITLKSYEKRPGFGDIAKRLGCPFFIKPANMGSSVGVGKVHNEAEYLAAVNEAFRFDVKILFEEYIIGRELECSVLGDEEPCASVVGEVKSTHEFYSYDAKYIDENGAALEIPAKLDVKISARIRELAVRAFCAIECEGLGRVDFFLRNNCEIIINEINTMPGFTKISMYPKLWEASGVSYSALIDNLIELAIKRFEKEKNLRTSV
ncbi:MAG: D-alanine--D-alanine ligase [Treponema sp.]|nr:D-alanine--D-alanine ligase [Treponema sp.]